MNISIKNKARHAVIWSALDSIFRQGGGFLISVILARLLTPEEFGTIALLATFVGIAGVFVNVGLGQALIQRQDINHVDESTVFWVTNVAALAVMLVLMAMSHWIAYFFDLPVLIPITIALAVNIVIGALGSIHQTLMNKRLDFKTPMRIGVISTLVSGVVAIYAALQGFGVWALVVQSLVGSLIGTALLWLLNSWRPLFQVSRDSFNKLFGFGGWVFASSLLDTIYQRGYELLIGKFYSMQDLGIFNRADSTQQLPVSVLTGILQRVSFPMMSAISHDKDLLLRGIRLSIRSMMLVTTPVMLGLLAVAEPFVAVTFGQQWLPSVPILQVLCIAGVLWPVHIVNLSALQVQGHSKKLFKLEVVKKCVGICFLVAGSLFGVIGIACGRVVSSIISACINSYYTKKFLGYGIFLQMKDITPTILMSVAMAVSVNQIAKLFESNTFVALFVLVFGGGGIYLLINIALGGQALKEALKLIRSNQRENE